MIKEKEKVIFPDQLVIGRNRFKRNAHDYSKAKVRKTLTLSTHVSLSVSIVKEQIIKIDIGGANEGE